MALERIFKNLVLVEFSLFVFIIFAVIFESEEITTISEGLSSGILDSDFGMLITIAFLFIYLVDLFLLYRFVNIGKTLFLILFIGGIFLTLFSGPNVSGSRVYILDWLEGVTNGALLVFLYFTPIKDKFAK
jgi:hypothetical protein